MKLETIARRIIRTLRGWKIADERADREDHPAEHAADLAWTIRQLKKAAKGT